MTESRKPRDAKYLRIEKNSVRIEIRRGQAIYRKSLLIDDYGTMARTLAAARKIRNEKLVEMDENKLVTHCPTVHELYLKKFELMPLSIKTREKHDAIYRDAIAEYGNKPIDCITAADIQKSLNKYAEKETRAQTARALSVWRQIYKTAYMLNYPVPNMTEAIMLPRCQPDKPVHDVAISPADFKAFCNAALSYNQYDEKGRYRSRMVWYLLQVMAYTGMRPAEALALSRNDFHFDGKPYIDINKACGSNQTTKRQIIHTKTRQSVRRVPMCDSLVIVVKALLEFTSHEYVFSDYDGSLIEINWLSNYIRLISKKCGVPFNMYRLRHAFSADLFKNNVPAPVIRDLMGHASMNMSLQYAYSTDKDRQTAIENRKMA